MVQQLQTMVGQSVDVMTNPNEMTFERYERHGTLREAALYIGLAAVVAGIFSLGSGALGFLEGVVNALIGFFLFTWLVYFIGKQQGGTGTFDEVAYTFALFIAPLTIIRGLISIHPSRHPDYQSAHAAFGAGIARGASRVCLYCRALQHEHQRQAYCDSHAWGSRDRHVHCADNRRHDHLARVSHSRHPSTKPRPPLAPARATGSP